MTFDVGFINFIKALLTIVYYYYLVDRSLYYAHSSFIHVCLKQFRFIVCFLHCADPNKVIERFKRRQRRKFGSQGD